MGEVKLKVGVAQIEVGYYTKEHNVEKILRAVDNAIREGINLILFPEGVNIGYFVMDRNRDVTDKRNLAYDLADTLNSEWICKLREKAFERIAVGCGLFLKTQSGQMYNTLVLILPTGRIHTYCKTHLFHTKEIEEKHFVRKGRKLSVVHWKNVFVGLSICYDLNFPEVFRTLALDGAQIVLLSAAWPKVGGRVWDILLPARALENQVFVLASNQTGGEYWGHSKIVDYTGTVIAESAEEEGIITAEINLERENKWRSVVPYFSDRRPKIYRL